MTTPCEAKKVCAICGDWFRGWGNNPHPFAGETCCDECDSRFVIPMRMIRLTRRVSDEDLQLIWQVANIGKAMMLAKLRISPDGVIKS